MGISAVAIIGDQGAEHQESGDLPGYASHHQVVAELLATVRVGGSCDPATSTLQDEREQVAQDEDPGVVFRPYP